MARAREGHHPLAKTATGLIYMNWIFSEVTLGLAAAAVANNIHSHIATAHLVITTLSLVALSSTCCLITCIEGSDGDEVRRAVVFFVVFINMFLYIGMIIPLSVSPIAKPDIHAGHVQFFNKSLSGTESTMA
ncbi:hypothetical protein N7478_009395 [Penicillium angulare]|uniref:uncharacterized protein n=1 Tax=Penicillium angulare TaxID=116970 RepID=UPI0025417972|nr:uncharacterized protein N7478_009395 [Penicillium angulare]KAJ5266587.1 hypothetical protein N7478_009395 [Penicillium angulare]